MRAIIVGGGIGGLTAAIALRGKGIEVEVYERSPKIAEVGAGISLWSNAAKALRKLGLGPALDSISLVNREGVIRRANGSFISRTPADELVRRFGGGVIVLHRAELLDLLAQSAGMIHLGHTCCGIDPHADGITAHFTNRATVTGDLLIGADGLHSFVRAWLGHKDPVRYSGYTAWRAVVQFDPSLIVPGETWGCGKRFGMLPVKGGRAYWFATTNAPEGETDAPRGARPRLLSLFKGWHEPVEALIQAASDAMILKNDIYDRDPLMHWGQGRVMLLGDAAHPMTPNLGQGGCQAIEDGLELAADLSKEETVDAGLTNYEARRIARTRSVVLASRRLGELGQIESPILCWLRDLGFQLTPNTLTMKSLAPVVGYQGHLED